AVLQLLEALAGVKRNELRLVRIVENGGGYRAAEIDIKAGPVALVVGDREAGQALVDAAKDFAAADRPLQRAGVVTLIDEGSGRDQHRDPKPDGEACSECTKHMSLSSEAENQGGS